MDNVLTTCVLCPNIHVSASPNVIASFMNDLEEKMSRKLTNIRVKSCALKHDT